VRHLKPPIEDIVDDSEQVRHWSRAGAPYVRESRVETVLRKNERSCAVDVSHREQNAQGTSPIKKVVVPAAPTPLAGDQDSN